MTSIANRRATFAALHANPDCFVLPNPFDVGSARLLQSAGFKALGTSSAGLAFANGKQDGGIGRDAAIAHAVELLAATDLPVSGDFENGYGDTPDEVVETVRLSISAGLSGCSIEDAIPGGGFYDFELAVERIRAAVAAKAGCPHFILTARSEAPILTDDDLSETLRRLQAFAAAGADVVYAIDLKQAGHIRRAAAEAGAPLNVLAGRRNFPLSRQDLADLGVRRMSLGAGLARTAYGSFYDAALTLAAEGRFEVPRDMQSFGSFNQHLL